MSTAADVIEVLAAARGNAGHEVIWMAGALTAVLKLHGSEPFYAGADDCGHVQPPMTLNGEPDLPADTDEWDDWDDNHPYGAGDVGRICLLTQIASFCPECTRLAYDDEEPSGDDYVPAPCATRTAITAALPAALPAEAKTGAESAGTLRCPACGSRSPGMHPAAGDGGEVCHLCPDPFHGPVPGNVQAVFSGGTGGGNG